MNVFAVDPNGSSYAALTGVEFCNGEFSVTQQMFDATLFIRPDTIPSEIEATIDSLLLRRPDWIFTTGPSSKYWHDFIGQRAVILGVQSQIGDGEPMTAWHDDVRSFLDWRRYHNLGSGDYHFFIFVGAVTVPSDLSSIKKYIEERDEEN